MNGRLARVPLYIGGFVGAYSGTMTTAILPELGSSFGLDAKDAAVAATAYMVPFALFMLVSGAVAQRIGAGRAIRLGFALFVLGSLVAATASAWPLFLLGYALAGTGNAFTTPIILAALSYAVPGHRLGAAFGLYAAMQSLGQLSSPLVGGLVAGVDWRIGFFSVAAVAALLAVVPSPRGTAPPPLRFATVRTAFRDRKVISLFAVVLGVSICLMGYAQLTVLHLEQRFGADAPTRGLLLTAGGALAFAAVGLLGQVVDRAGARKVLIVVLVAAAGALAGILWAPSILVAGVFAAVCTLCGHGAVVATNRALFADRRGPGLISFLQATRFSGAALAPVTVVPLFAVAPVWGFLPPALGLLVIAVMIAARGHASR